jgi:hypothetical protein
MEKVSIQEASRRLRISTASVRECIRAGELKAERAPGPNGRTSWMVEMPEEGWTSAAVAEELNRSFTPWWWGNKEKTGKVHYVQDLFNTPFEEIMPRFLCGYEGANIWSAPNLTEEVLCPECLVEVENLGLPPSR